MTKVITIHGIGKTSPDYADKMFSYLTKLGKHFVGVPIFWEKHDLTPWWVPLPIEWLVDLGLAILAPTRKTIMAEIRKAVEKKNNDQIVVIAHSHGVWFALEALRKQAPIDLLVTMGRTSTRLGGLLFPGLKEVRVDRWLNLHSQFDPISGAIDPLLLAGQANSLINLEIQDLLHSQYWTSARVALLISRYWPGEPLPPAIDEISSVLPPPEVLAP